LSEGAFRTVRQPAERPLPYPPFIPPVPPPPPCGTGDTPAPGPAALLLPRPGPGVFAWETEVTPGQGQWLTRCCFVFLGACPETLNIGAEAARCFEILIAWCNMRNCKPHSNMRRIATLWRQAVTPMSYTLGEAAKAVGFSKPTLSRAIKSGKLSARRLDDGSYSVDASELERWKDANGHRSRDMKRIRNPHWNTWNTPWNQCIAGWSWEASCPSAIRPARTRFSWTAHWGSEGPGGTGGAQGRPTSRAPGRPTTPSHRQTEGVLEPVVWIVASAGFLAFHSKLQRRHPHFSVGSP